MPEIGNQLNVDVGQLRAGCERVCVVGQANLPTQQRTNGNVVDATPAIIIGRTG